MAHESFEDADDRRVMNRLFVNVKVDREERPDVDADLHAGGAGADRPRRLADDRVVHARRPARSTAAPTSRTTTGTACRRSPGVRGGRRGVARAARRRRASRPTSSPTRSTSTSCAPTPRARASTPRLLARARTRTSRAQFEPSFGGFGRAPKFPQAMTLDFLLPRATCATRARDARDDHDHARRDGRGRHLRPARRRLRPLLDRRLLARPALREDALRQRAARRARTCTAYLVTGERAVPRASSRRSSATCCATCATRRAASSPPRTPTPKAIEGKFYLLVARRDPRGVRRRRRRGRSRYYGVTADGNFVDPHTQLPRQHPARRRPHRPSRPDAVAAGASRAARRGATRRVRPGLDDKVLLGWNALFLAGAHRGGRRARPRRLDGRGPRRTRRSSSASCAATTAGSCARGARPTSPTPRTTPRCSKRCCTLAELDDVAWLDDAAPGRRRAVRLFARPGRRRVLHDRARRRALVVRPKDVFDNATPSANSLAANGLLRLAALTGDRRYEEPAVAVLTHARPRR